jgi:lysophospholipase L1-like esterase
MRLPLLLATLSLLACEPPCQCPAKPAPVAAVAPAATPVPPPPPTDSAAAAPAPSAAPVLAPEPAPDVPAPRDRDYPWMSLDTWWKHQRELLALDPALKRQSELAFLGDSITEMWDDAVWKESFGRYRPLRLGIGGDKTQQVLYRIDHGELDGVGSRVVVLLIGTNNFGLGDSSPASVATGVSAVISRVAAKLPKTRILLLGILPRDELPGTELRIKVKETNALLEKLAGDRVHYLDIGATFLDAQGKIPKELMGDFLHPTPKGYRAFATAITPKLKQLLGMPKP